MGLSWGCRSGDSGGRGGGDGSGGPDGGLRTYVLMVLKRF